MNKLTIHLAANNQQLTSADCPKQVASNTVSYIEAVFDLGDNWTGYDSVRAVWATYNNQISTVLDSQGTCIVPHEVLTETQTVYVNLVGSNVEGDELVDRLTTYPLPAIIVNADALVEGTETAEVTPSQFEQFIADVAEEVSRIKDIVSTTLNDDYTLTFVFSDGTETTVGPIRGEQGPQGETGPQGPEGPPGEVTLATLESLMPTDTANGSIASFPDGQSVFPLKSCVVQINPIQDTSGGDPSPSNICPISGRDSVEVIDDPTYGGFINWNQLLKSTNDSDTNRGVSFSRNPSTGLFTLSGTSTTTYTSLFSSFTAIKDHIYCGIANLVTNPNNVSFKVAALNINWGSGNMKKNNTTQTTSVGFLGFSANTNFTGITGYFHILDLTEIFGATKADEILAMETNQSGSGVAYVKSIFPNDYYAYNAGTKTNASAVNGTPYLDYTISLGTTVYGGTLNVVSGVLTIDKKQIVFDSNTSWQYSSSFFFLSLSDMEKPPTYNDRKTGIICSMYPPSRNISLSETMDDNSMLRVGTTLYIKATSYGSDVATFKSSVIGGQLVYNLATPTTIQLTPTQVQTLLGTNNIFADSGDVSVEYVADIQGYVDKQIQ